MRFDILQVIFMENIVIRKVKNEDINSLVAIFKKVYLPLFKSQKYTKEAIEIELELNDANHLLSRFKGNYFFVAEDIKKNKIVGLIGLKKDKNSKIHNRISTFCILQGYRGKGVGSMLFNEIFCLAKRLKIRKIVVSSSIYAEEIYRHWEFRKTKIITKTYPDNEVHKNVWMERIISY
jgi:N-acetylglutamate synthase-like GNAT family acetyltransferase